MVVYRWKAAADKFLLPSPRREDDDELKGYAALPHVTVYAVTLLMIVIRSLEAVMAPSRCCWCCCWLQGLAVLSSYFEWRQSAAGGLLETVCREC